MKELDLHGVRHIDVANTVKRFIEDNWDSTDEVRIITGHSPKMVELVAKELKLYDLDWRHNHTKSSMIVTFFE